MFEHSQACDLQTPFRKSYHITKTPQQEVHVQVMLDLERSIEDLLELKTSFQGLVLN